MIDKNTLLKTLLGIGAIGGTIYVINTIKETKGAPMPPEQPPSKPTPPSQPPTKPPEKPTGIADPYPSQEYYDGMIYVIFKKATWRTARPYVNVRLGFNGIIDKVRSTYRRPNLLKIYIDGEDYTGKFFGFGPISEPFIHVNKDIGSEVHIKVPPLIWTEHGIPAINGWVGYKGMDVKIKLPNETGIAWLYLNPFMLVNGKLVNSNWFREHLQKLDIHFNGHYYITRAILYVKPSEVSEKLVFYYVSRAYEVLSDVKDVLEKRVRRYNPNINNAYVSIEPRNGKIYVNHNYAWRHTSDGKVVIEFENTYSKKPYNITTVANKIKLVFSDGEYYIGDFI